MITSPKKVRLDFSIIIFPFYGFELGIFMMLIVVIAHHEEKLSYSEI